MWGKLIGAIARRLRPRARSSWAPQRADRDAMDRLLETMQAELARADQLDKGRHLERILRVQSALIVDLRNRLRALEVTLGENSRGECHSPRVISTGGLFPPGG